jgi:hypothetical protein
MSTTFPAPTDTTPRAAHVAWAAFVPALVLVALVLAAVAVPATGVASLVAVAGALAALAGVAVLDSRARSGPAAGTLAAVTPAGDTLEVGPAEVDEPVDPHVLRLRELSVVTDDAVHRAMAAGHVGAARDLFARSIDEAVTLIDPERRDPA